jgi:hypothetical protein
MKHLRIEQEQGHAPGWLVNLASWPDGGPGSPEMKLPDPQRSWLHLHGRITEFLNTIPLEQQLRVRSEDFLTSPERTLRQILNWMALESGDEAIESMQHPERWPYAMMGPRNARFGTDRFFLERPALRPERVEPQSLTIPLPWRADGAGFLPDVMKMANEYGYD